MFTITIIIIIIIERLYVPRNFGGRGLVSVSFAIQHERRNLSIILLMNF